MLWHAESVFDYLELYGVMLLGFMEYIAQTATTALNYSVQGASFVG